MLSITEPRAGVDLDDDVLLNSAQTKEFFGEVSDMCLWRWERDPLVQLPPPIRINGRKFWARGDLRATVARLRARSKQAA